MHDVYNTHTWNTQMRMCDYTHMITHMLLQVHDYRHVIADRYKQSRGAGSLCLSGALHIFQENTQYFGSYLLQVSRCAGSPCLDAFSHIVSGRTVDSFLPWAFSRITPSKLQRGG